MLLERGIVVSYETVRRWAMKFGRDDARRFRRKRPSPRDIWHLDEVVVSIGGKKHWLWRAVDQDGYVLDEIVQARRDTKAAGRLLRRLLKKQGCPPRRMITDKLGSYAAARRQIMPAVEHRSHKGLNNRAENSHVPLRKRERAMQGFRSPGGLQRFTTVHSAVRNPFVQPRSHRSALSNRLHRLDAMAQWKAVAGITASARRRANFASLRQRRVNVTSPLYVFVCKNCTRQRQAGRHPEDATLVIHPANCARTASSSVEATARL